MYNDKRAQTILIDIIAYSKPPFDAIETNLHVAFVEYLKKYRSIEGPNRLFVTEMVEIMDKQRSVPPIETMILLNLCFEGFWLTFRRSVEGRNVKGTVAIEDEILM